VLALEDTTAGSTLTICVVNHERREATVLHAGDSVARLVPLRSRSAALCEEHRVEGSAAERDRLVVLGGRIAYATNASGESSGPRRLWPGGVAQARAIGDSDVGRFIEPRPFAHTVALPAEPCCIVVCSDGVWDAMLPADVDAVARPSTCTRTFSISPREGPAPQKAEGDRYLRHRAHGIPPYAVCLGCPVHLSWASLHLKSGTTGGSSVSAAAHESQGHTIALLVQREGRAAPTVHQAGPPLVGRGVGARDCHGVARAVLRLQPTRRPAAAR